MFVCPAALDPANSGFPLHCSSLCVGWSDGAECDSQIQEEIRHLSALQAYLNLSSGAPQCF